jgi:hypothetical protein
MEVDASNAPFLQFLDEHGKVTPELCTPDCTGATGLLNGRVGLPFLSSAPVLSHRNLKAMTAIS